MSIFIQCLCVPMTICFSEKLISWLFFFFCLLVREIRVQKVKKIVKKPIDPLLLRFHQYPVLVSQREVDVGRQGRSVGWGLVQKSLSPALHGAPQSSQVAQVDATS